MSTISPVKKLCLCALCVALCPILPMALHPLGLGGIISPMHIPPLLCGLLVGWPYGLACGLAGPVLSHLTSGMPNPPFLFFMMFELGPTACSPACCSGGFTPAGCTLICTPP